MVIDGTNLQQLFKNGSLDTLISGRKWVFFIMQALASFGRIEG
jgi:hypothetical protein